MDYEEILQALRYASKRWGDAPALQARAREFLRREREYRRHAARRANAGRDLLPDWVLVEEGLSKRKLREDAELRALLLDAGLLPKRGRARRERGPHLDMDQPTSDEQESPGQVMAGLDLVATVPEFSGNEQPPSIAHPHNYGEIAENQDSGEV